MVRRIFDAGIEQLRLCDARAVPGRAQRQRGVLFGQSDVPWHAGIYAGPPLAVIGMPAPTPVRCYAAAVAAAIALLVPGGGARAQNFPWCLVKSESRTCGYASFEQCMAARSVGGFCEQNFLFHGENRPPKIRPR